MLCTVRVFILSWSRACKTSFGFLALYSRHQANKLHLVYLSTMHQLFGLFTHPSFPAHRFTATYQQSADRY